MKGTDIIFFINNSGIPVNRRKDVTYTKFVCTIHPNKTEPNRTCITLGRDCIHYPNNVSTPTANLLLFKLHLNSIISIESAYFVTANISNFYLKTPQKQPKYVFIILCNVPNEIIKEYKLSEKVGEDRYIYIEFRKWMYGLPQAGILTQKLLSERLGQHGYILSRIMLGLWSHVW